MKRLTLDRTNSKEISYYVVHYNGNEFHVTQTVDERIIEHDIRKMETQEERVTIIKALTKDLECRRN